MNTIKNIHKLAGIVADGDIDKLEAGASLHKRHSNITFKIVKVFGDELHVRAEQGKHLSANYADTKTLITRSRELFGKFLPGKTIYTHPVPYAESQVNIVDQAWVNKQMLEKQVKLKDIANDTGIDKSQLSATITGDRPMSQIMKALFYFYFTSK